MNSSKPSPEDTLPQRICLFTTIFDTGGVISYWQEVISHTPNLKWDIFANATEHVRPFQQPNVTYNYGIRWPKMWRTSRNFWDYVATHKPNLVIFNGTLAEILVLPVIVFMMFFCPKVRLHCVYHNRVIYAGAIKSAFNRIVLSVLGWLHHKNIFVSQAVQQYWWCPGKIYRRPFLPKARMVENKPEYCIGFLGRISWEKGPDLFLEIFKHLKIMLAIQGIGIRAQIAGDGALRQELEKQVASDARVQFIGWINSPRQFLSSIDLLVVSSRTEGYPLAVGESLEEGTPVAGFNVGGIAEVIGPRGDQSWLVSKGDIEGLTAKLASVFLDYEAAYRKYFSDLRECSFSKEELTSSWVRNLLGP